MIQPSDPIHPVRRFKSIRRNETDPDKPIETFEDKPGLTVRTHIASQIAAALVSPQYTADQKVPKYDAVARAAVNYADALLAELNKTEEDRRKHFGPYQEVTLE